VKPRVTVLLVDDHAVVREGYRRLLEESGQRYSPVALSKPERWAT
jgi:DNA-binding NarL/FixJ family response regulator